MLRRLLVILLVVGLLQPTPAASIEPFTLIVVATKVVQFYNALNSGAGIGRRDVSAIQSQLATISQELAEINAKLDAVLKELKELKVAIQDVPDAVARDQVKAAIGEITSNYSGWVTHWSQPRYKTEAQEAYGKLQIAAEGLMSRRSFANYDLTGLAMLYEQYMFELLDREQEFRRDTFGQFQRYFRAAQEPSEIGSLMARMVAADSQASNLQTLHAAIDGRKPISTFVGKTHADESRGVWVDTCKYHVHRVIFGNLTVGYSDQPEQYVFTNKHDCSTHRERGGGGPGGKPVRISSVSPEVAWAAMLSPGWEEVNNSCPDPFNSDPNSVCLSQLVTSRNEFLTLRQQQAALAAAVQAARSLEAVAQRLASQTVAPGHARPAPGPNPQRPTEIHYSVW